MRVRVGYKRGCVMRVRVWVNEGACLHEGRRVGMEGVV